MAQLPNLPGYRSNNQVRQRRTQGLKFVNGYPVFMDSPTDSGIKRELTNYEALRRNAPKAPVAPLPTLPKWLSNDRQVCQFAAFFKESVAESANESFRVRKCNIYYYMEDDTIHISEPKQANSGMPQGTFIKRHKVPSTVEGKQYVDLDDLRVGKNVTIYGRTFHITDCDGRTKSLLESQGKAVRATEEVPSDPYSEVRAAHMARETGADPSVYRGTMRNPMKDFMEARLGNASKNNQALGNFLQFDKKVLKFDCVWDDRARYKGILRRLRLHYYLADDTVEICEVYSRNSGFDGFPRLLEKSRLPKVGAGASYVQKDGVTEYIGWADLSIGATLNVFGRPVQIADADNFTRSFYEAQGQPLADGIVIEEEKVVLAQDEEPPPHNGFGTEEDSRMSWESLHPKPPKKDLKKILKYDRKVLRYIAKLSSDKADDQMRSFVIQYFLADDTMSVFEPPQRNTGIVGAKFLRKSKQRHPDTGEYYKPEDFQVGSLVQLGGFRFEIVDIDESTSQWLDKSGLRRFSHANIKNVIRKLVIKLRRNSSTIHKTFRALDEDHNNYITVNEMEKFLQHYFTDDELTDEEVLAVMRFFDTDGEGRIDYNEFAAKILGKDVGTTSYATSAGEEMGDTRGDDDEFEIDPEAMRKYMEVTRRAQREDEIKAALELAVKVMIKNSNSIPRDRRVQEFRAKDTDFQNEISREDFEDICVSLLHLKPIYAESFCDHVFRKLNKEVITFDEYEDVFRFPWHPQSWVYDQSLHGIFK